jgi:hypothetical protein
VTLHITTQHPEWANHDDSFVRIEDERYTATIQQFGRARASAIRVRNLSGDIYIENHHDLKVLMGVLDEVHQKCLELGI